ncbi:MAG TPA: SGNH/GDSL hydrolase family protein [bacterium]|nr:SGNH/GDSL hydrolase family protein [bacterium]HPT29868.1 SGNH/GDSL hydrolase family protein [bacterium]
MAKIFCFGDSITYGAWDMTGGGWATRLRVLLDAQQAADPNLYFLTYNIGVCGETTAGLVSRFLPDVQARLNSAKQEELIFIFAYGTNDACFTPSQNRFRVEIDDFEKNLESVIGQAKKFGGKIFILNISPVDESQASHPENKDNSRFNKYVDSYNDRIKALAAREDIQFIDINAAFRGHDYLSLLCEDGLHPNDSGHEVIFREVLKNLGF